MIKNALIFLIILFAIKSFSQADSLQMEISNYSDSEAEIISKGRKFSDFKRTSIRTGIGIGINEGRWETGVGFVYSIGLQKSYGNKSRLRVNPNLLFGGFLPIVITDTRDQFYRITSLGINIHYDLLKYKSVSIVTTIGGFTNYSRGLLGTGGWPEANNSYSEYFYKIYFGGNTSLGLRINPKNSKLAFEIRPINIQFGNNYFLLGYYMFGIDFKLKK
jgi:hypothetical protein